MQPPPGSSLGGALDGPCEALKTVRWSVAGFCFVGFSKEGCGRPGSPL